MKIYDTLFNGAPIAKISKLLYQVDDEVSKKLNNDNNPPAHMEESALINYLAGVLNKPSAAVTYAGLHSDAALKSHMAACAKKLKEAFSSIVRREMIGEIYAAVRCKMNGWTMIRGYAGSGHTGIDQIWKFKESSGLYKGTYLVVVEAKGGRGKLSERLSYQTSYSSKGDPVFLNKVSYSQMTRDWIFIVADSEIGCEFVSLVGKISKSLTLVSDEAKKACWLICSALYNPDSYIDKASIGAMRKAVALALGLDRGNYSLPGVWAVTITNGQVTKSERQAIAIASWTYDPS